jgi:hypothetical protein
LSAALLLTGCALSPGSMPIIYVHAQDACVSVTVYGNPIAGQSDAKLEVPLSPLGVRGAVADPVATPDVVTHSCTVRADHHDTTTEQQ